MILLRAYASIWDFINSIFGTHILSMPPQTYGFFMAIAFIVGVTVAQKELKRRTDAGIFSRGTKEIIEGDKVQWQDVLLYALFGYFLGLKALGIYLNEALFSANPQEYLISLQGSNLGGIIGAALLGGYVYYQQKKKELAQPITKTISYNAEDRMGEILMLAMAGGILGSKILDAFDNPASMRELLANPIGSLTSGLSVLGGLWLAALLLIIYARRNKLHILPFADALSPAFFIAYAVGRLGCQFSGDGCWGIPSNPFVKPSFIPDFLWGSTYAHNVNREGNLMLNCLEPYCTILPEPHFPTPLYETLMVSVLFGIIWMSRKYLTPSFGAITGLFLIFNGLERFLIEFIRENHKYNYFGFEFSQAQYISLIMILLGAMLVYWAVHINKGKIKL